MQNVALHTCKQNLNSYLKISECQGKMFTAFGHAKTQKHTLMYDRMSDKCCMLYWKSHVHLTVALHNSM